MLQTSVTLNKYLKKVHSPMKLDQVLLGFSQGCPVIYTKTTGCLSVYCTISKPTVLTPHLPLILRSQLSAVIHDNNIISQCSYRWDSNPKLCLITGQQTRKEVGTTSTALLKHCFEFISKFPVYDTKEQATNHTFIKHCNMLRKHHKELPISCLILSH